MAIQNTPFKKLSLKNLLLIFVTLIISVALVALSYDTKKTSSNNKVELLQKQLRDYGFYLREKPYPIEVTELINLKGETVNFPLQNGSWQLINFGYLFCPDICPINLRLLADIKERWNDLDLSTAITINHITFDPQRDQPKNLQAYLAYHHPEIIGFSGKIENIQTLAQQVYYMFVHEKPDQNGNYFISHSDSIALLNPEGIFVGLFKGPYQLESFMKALRIMITTYN